MESGASAEDLYKLWANNGLEKNHYDAVVDIKPPNLPDIWSLIEPDSRGRKYEHDLIVEFLEESENENIEAYLIEIMKMNFGSCLYDW